MFRSTSFIVHKVQSTELNMRHSVLPQVLCHARTSVTAVILLRCWRNVRRLQNAKWSRIFTPFEFLMRHNSSSNDYWPGVLIVPYDGIFVNYCPWFGSENGCFACCRLVLHQRQNELPLEPPHVGWHSVTVVCRLRRGA